MATLAARAGLSKVGHFLRSLDLAYYVLFATRFSRRVWHGGYARQGVAGVRRWQTMDK